MKVKACRASDIPRDGMIVVEIEGERVCFANANGAYFAISDTCTHAEASLAEGYLDVKECTVECPLHNAVFSLRTGEALEFPAEDPVRWYPVSVEDDDIFVELG